MAKYVAVAGATGYTGQRVIAQLGQARNWRGRALVRNAATAAKTLPAAQDLVECNLNDVASLSTALEGCAAIIQTIGTTKAQFAPGISYETVDYGTTIALLQAAKNVGIRRFVLLSSMGAGKPMGEYLRWKARTEQAVQTSGLEWVIVRPAAIVGPQRKRMAVASMPFKVLAALPVVGRFGARLQAIDVEDLARALIASLDVPARQILEGRSLWREVKRG